MVAYVIGLGYYKLHVSGKKVSNHELGSFTTYTERVYYDTLDCTDATLLGGDTLTIGRRHFLLAFPSFPHCLLLLFPAGIHIGDGWYSQKTVKVGKPQLLMRVSITYADGTKEDVVVSSTSYLSSFVTWVTFGDLQTHAGA